MQVDYDPTLTPQSFMYQKDVEKAELKEMRPWIDIDSLAGHKGTADSKVTGIRLYLHEVYMLQTKRDREGEKPIRSAIFPKVTRLNRNNYWDHMEVALAFLHTARKKIEAMPDGARKVYSLNGLEVSEGWWDWIELLLSGRRHASLLENSGHESEDE